MNSLRRNPLIYWLLMLCISLQGLGLASHRVGHVIDEVVRNGAAPAPALTPAPALLPLAASSTLAATPTLDQDSGDAHPQTIDLCLFCANLAAVEQAMSATAQGVMIAGAENGPQTATSLARFSLKHSLTLARAPPNRFG